MYKRQPVAVILLICLHPSKAELLILESTPFIVTVLRLSLIHILESTQKYVTGEVKFKLYKGNIIKAGTTSPYSLYSETLASFTTGDQYDLSLIHI